MVLVNLLSNARQAVAARTGDVSIAHPTDTNGSNGSAVVLATARLSEHRVAISVRDRGIGIAADDLPRIFDPYFTTHRAGTGLGLPIAKNIIDGLGGSLSVDSQADAGTAIRIELGDAPAPRA